MHSREALVPANTATQNWPLANDVSICAKPCCLQRREHGHALLHSCIKELYNVCTAREPTAHGDCCSSVFQPAVAKLCQYNAGSHGKLAHALASHVRPAALAEFDKAMAAVFVAGAEVSTSACPSPAATQSRCQCFCFCVSAGHLSALDVFSLAAEGTACFGLVVCRLPMHTVYALRIKRCHTLHLAERHSV